jgi:hypothetical protein
MILRARRTEVSDTKCLVLTREEEIAEGRIGEGEELGVDLSRELKTRGMFLTDNSVLLQALANTAG